MSQPDFGRIIAGIFLIMFGLCTALLGGGCTVAWIGVIFSNSGSNPLGGLVEAFPLILLSLFTLFIGIVSIRGGIRMFRSD